MPCNMRDRVALDQCWAQRCERVVLRRLKAVTLKAFEFDANRVVVAIAAAPIVRCSSMPGPVVTADKLPEVPVALDVEVCGHLQPLDLLEVSVLVPVQLIGKQQLHLVATIHARGQANRVQHNQVDARVRWSGSVVGGRDPSRERVPAVLPHTGTRHARVIHPGHRRGAHQSSGVRCGSGFGADSNLGVMQQVSG